MGMTYLLLLLLLGWWWRLLLRLMPTSQLGIRGMGAQAMTQAMGNHGLSRAIRLQVLPHTELRNVAPAVIAIAASGCSSCSSARRSCCAKVEHAKCAKCRGLCRSHKQGLIASSGFPTTLAHCALAAMPSTSWTPHLAGCCCSSSVSQSQVLSWWWLSDAWSCW